ncbi:MAG: type II toxin-antitoxin system YoeB family toxin [Jiangellaceae bacterium]
MRLVFTPHGGGDDTHWLRADRATLTRINRLIDDALRDPVAGIGDDLVILQASFHYT